MEILGERLGTRNEIEFHLIGWSFGEIPRIGTIQRILVKD